MATIETTIERDRDLTVHTVTGELTPEEILAKLDDYFKGEPTSRILWDATKATWSGVDFV